MKTVAVAQTSVCRYLTLILMRQKLKIKLRLHRVALVSMPQKELFCLNDLEISLHFVLLREMCLLCTSLFKCHF